MLRNLLCHSGFHSLLQIPGLISVGCLGNVYCCVQFPIARVLDNRHKHLGCRYWTEIHRDH